ncbi:bifunctional [glutamate--ammonia ligase]-adenylyl-L-tyrosine phosphorylase/[glutamate--ammonia-ligase] adenylyltransferase [Vulgatibacter sp.]|uniref:bifunctional [glutamate--ammonia ligase]-adenylyl-L-tyrosine phosphorylase/[glutamate--ammonia-ligase] adenylyltransferase n=1 Tax=Vulgatibacter sp. TaxID=1971226 RepID=UPI0035667BDD
MTSPDPRNLLLLQQAGIPAGALDAATGACAETADPAATAGALARWVEAWIARYQTPPRLDPVLLGRLVPVLAGSRFLVRELCARPRLAMHLAATPFYEVAKPRERLLRELRRRVGRVPKDDEAGLLRALRRFKYREFLRLAARDLGGSGPLPDVAAELSLLAEVCVEVALERIAAESAARHGEPAGAAGLPGLGLSVLGMGKLGAGELNFSSDIDLILLYRAEGETAGGPGGRIPNRQFYARVAERLVKALSAATEDGFVFRVDLDLRPEGRAGPIAQSADSAYRYYEAKGRTWERAALLKARAMAGDVELGEELLESLAPFIYRRTLDLQAVEEIRAMKARIDRETAAGWDDLKLGPGGIREAEFVAVALLLLYAGKDARLRERGTLAALDKLLFAGRLSARDRDELAAGWLLLRRAEHRIQTLDERQTHRLPAGDADRRRIALGLGYQGPPEAALATFLAELRARREHVGEMFGDLLGVSGAAPREQDPVLQRALDPARPDAERIQALAERGFFDPASALAELERLARRPDTPFAENPPVALEGQAEELVAEATRTPNPDQAMRHLANFGSALLRPGPWFELLARNPATARLLLELFGTSDFLSKYFVRHPELLDGLIRRDLAVPRKGAELLHTEAAARMAGREADDLEGRLAALRRFKNEEVLRIGLNDVSGALDLEGVMAELTAVADACLRQSLALARSELVERYGEPGGGSRMAVLGLGKLGGAELGYHSDLDLIFLYAHSEGESEGGSRGQIANPEWFARLAQRLLSHLQVPLREGTLYKIDTRLRPSGSQGALVVSLAALAAYHARESALWERQALLRARWVAGDAAVAARAWREVLSPTLFRADLDPEETARAIAAMRARMEAEISGEKEGVRNPKTGYGGLVDLEFAVQYLLLVHGAADPALCSPNTMEAMRRLAAAGLLAEGDAAILADAYRFLRRLELRMQIVHDRETGHLPRTPFDRLTLARRMGYAGARSGDDLLADYERITHGVREAFRRILGIA